MLATIFNLPLAASEVMFRWPASGPARPVQSVYLYVCVLTLDIAP